MLRKHDDFSKYCKSQVKKRDETLDSFHQKNEMLDLFISEIENTATQIVEMVARNVSDALNEEIQKLAVIVNEFDRPFRPDNELINVYKQDLHNHVGKKFESNLFQRFDEFQEDVKATQKRMKDRLALLLEDESLHTDIGLPGRMFNQFFKWNYDEVCVEFQEDINFRFSLMRYLSNGLQGIMRIVKWAAIFMQRPHSATCIELKDEPMHIFFVIVFTVVHRTRAKNAALLAALVYAGMYLREWWTWTDKTKESRLKSQYKEYACNKVKSIVNQIIFKCSNEVKRDLSSTGDELREAIRRWKHGMEDDIRTCSKEIQRLEDKAEQFKFLGNKTHELEKELNSFIDEFLKKND